MLLQPLSVGDIVSGCDASLAATADELVSARLRIAALVDELKAKAKKISAMEV